ncbi:MAG: YafY family transcriptional regulator [Planctomycetes bacterium]|nr:YafY family transcriptional regulator [Planctomycetota bacterium]
MQYLRSHSPPIRAEDLADELNVSLRSIYRDIDSLRNSGAVIDGEAGFGYTLEEDPALPPMMFSRDEMEAMVLGLREVREVGDPVLADAADNALGKLKACLPDRMRIQLDHAVLHAKRFHERPEIAIDVAALRQATWEEKAVDISYVDANSRPSERRVFPLAIVFMDQALALVTWCKLREDYRYFRIDRITTMQVSEESFRPKRVSLLHELSRSMGQFKSGN